MVVAPKIRISSAITMNVYWRRNARRTIHKVFSSPRVGNGVAPVRQTFQNVCSRISLRGFVQDR
jgi:hypothetical protein